MNHTQAMLPAYHRCKAEEGSAESEINSKNLTVHTHMLPKPGTGARICLRSPHAVAPTHRKASKRLTCRLAVDDEGFRLRRRFIRLCLSLSLCLSGCGLFCCRGGRECRQQQPWQQP
eukprot:6193714-Pleurochrysis_carterae.AAC.3